VAFPSKRRRPGGPVTALELRERYDEAIRDLSWEHRQYWVNEAFCVYSEQNVTWDEARHRPDTLLPNEAGWTPVVSNHLLPNSRTLVAKLLRRPLGFEVPPSGPDDASVAGARKAEAVLAHQHREHNWESLRREHAWDTWLGGTGALALEWDPKGGQALGSSSETGKPYGTGDTREFALPITEVVTEPGCRDIERARWWIRATALPPAEVAELYGLDQKPAADASASMSPLQHRMAGSGSDGGTLALVLTYYERPCGDSPGQVVVVVGEQVVAKGPWPFPFRDRLNVVVARETPLRRRWTGGTVLSAAISPQRALNRAESSVEEHMDKAGNARLAVEDGSVDDDQWDDDPASIVKVRPGTMNAPAYLSPPQMPAWWQERPDALRLVIDDTLGVHDISRGQAPAGAGSGVALSLLSEQDDTPLGAFAKELAETWGRFASLVLQTLAAKATEPRTARLEAPGQVPTIIRWSGAELAGHTTAVVPFDDVAPTSRAAQLQKGLLLLDKGVFGLPGDPGTTRRFLDFVDMPGGTDVDEAVDFHAAKAQRENHELAIGIVKVPADFDDHTTHIREHNRFRCSDAYERLAEDVRALVDTHVDAHETLAAEEMGEQMAKAAVSPALAAAAQAHEPPGSGEPVPTDPAAAPADPAASGGTPAVPGAAGPRPQPPTAAPGTPAAA
jgi:hypothetical protein